MFEGWNFVGSYMVIRDSHISIVYSIKPRKSLRVEESCIDTVYKGMFYRINNSFLVVIILCKNLKENCLSLLSLVDLFIN